MQFQIRNGFDNTHRPLIASLYWQAFSPKLGKIMRPDDRAVAFFQAIIDSDYAISAVGQEGQLLGVAGFKTSKGAFTSGGFTDLAQAYGWLGAVHRGFLLELLERDLEEGVLLMDGIFVAENARGLGIGSALLDAICDEAGKRKLSSVRLDVIDTNPRAKSLYERKGFIAGETKSIGVFKYLFGFGASTTMTKTIS